MRLLIGCKERRERLHGRPILGCIIGEILGAGRLQAKQLHRSAARCFCESGDTCVLVAVLPSRLSRPGRRGSSIRQPLPKGILKGQRVVEISEEIFAPRLFDVVELVLV